MTGRLFQIYLKISEVPPPQITGHLHILMCRWPVIWPVTTPPPYKFQGRSRGKSRGGAQSESQPMLQGSQTARSRFFGGGWGWWVGGGSLSEGLGGTVPTLGGLGAPAPSPPRLLSVRTPCSVMQSLCCVLKACPTGGHTSLPPSWTIPPTTLDNTRWPHWPTADHLDKYQTSPDKQTHVHLTRVVVLKGGSTAPTSHAAWQVILQPLLSATMLNYVRY